LEDDVRSIKSFLGVNPFHQQSQFATSSNSNLAINDQLKKSNMSLNFGMMNTSGEAYNFDENFHSKRFPSQSPPKRHDNSINEVGEDSFDGSHVIQLEKDTLKLRRDLQDAIASKKQAENRILAYVQQNISIKYYWAG
jgi:hypothetical protein